MKPRLVVTGVEKRSASRARISKDMRSRRSKKSNFRQLARPTSRITAKATKQGMSLMRLRFTHLQENKKTRATQGCSGFEREATIPKGPLVAACRDTVRIGPHRSHADHGVVGS